MDRIGPIRSTITVGRACLDQCVITVHQTLDRSRSAVLLSADDLQAYSLQTAVVNLSTALTTTEYSTTNTGRGRVIASSCSSCHPTRSLLSAGQFRGVRESVAIGCDLSALTLSVSHASRTWKNHSHAGVCVCISLCSVVLVSDPDQRNHLLTIVPLLTHRGKP